MLWALVLIFSALCYGLMRLCHRVLVKPAGTIAYLTLFNLICLAVVLPLAFLFGNLPSDPITYWYLFGLAIVIILSNYIGIKSFEYVEVSIREPFVHTDLIWIAILSVVFLGEVISVLDLVGAAFVLFGIGILHWSHGSWHGALRNRGVQLALLAAFVGSAINILNKLALPTLVPISIMVVGYGSNVVAFAPFAAARPHGVRRLWRSQWKLLLLACSLSLLAYGSFMLALAHTSVLESTIIVRLAAIVAVFGALWFFPAERHHIPRKLIATGLVLAGCILTVL